QRSNVVSGWHARGAVRTLQGQLSPELRRAGASASPDCGGTQRLFFASWSDRAVPAEAERGRQKRRPGLVRGWPYEVSVAAGARDGLPGTRAAFCRAGARSAAALRGSQGYVSV